MNILSLLSLMSVLSVISLLSLLCILCPTDKGYTRHSKSWGRATQAAWNINDALAQLGVVKVVRAGDPHPGGRASQFRYLLA
jgi:hypothetical protein